ncbi:MAG: glycosyltransferase family 9 protein [Psychrilyobacter sp.]|uniref:glycosyltransferase family 9 protein n=1 Tax=Psychrilyobacter sp. TaxID=2586924 RepID=UPI003C71BEA0
MKKPKFLKTSYLKQEIREFLIKILFLFNYFEEHYKNSEKSLLISSTDGMGDAVVRQKLLDMIVEKEAKIYDNIYILASKNSYEFFKIFGYNVILRSDDERTKLIKRIKLIKKLTNLNIEKVIHLEFDIQDEFIRYLKCKEKIGFNNIYHPETNKLLTQVIKMGDKYVLEDCVSFANEYFDKTFKLEELKPDLEKKMKNENSNYNIVIGVGANSKTRIIDIKRTKEYIDKIYELYPKKQITLIGKGELEFKISKKLEIEFPKLKNFVNKLSLEETIDEIQNSDLYIGYDSGLYNLAFGFNKKIICFFGGNKKTRFYHNKFNEVEILSYIEVSKPCNIIKNSDYGTYELNNISVENFEVSLIKLMNRS